MLQVFESHAECLSPYLFTLYAFPHLEDIAVRVKQRLGKDAVPMVSRYMRGCQKSLHNKKISKIFLGELFCIYDHTFAETSYSTSTMYFHLFSIIKLYIQPSFWIAIKLKNIHYRVLLL